MESSESAEERRETVRRSNTERRFGERRMPERAQVGRRVENVPDRRSAEERRQAP